MTYIPLTDPDLQDELIALHEHLAECGFTDQEIAAAIELWWQDRRKQVLH